MKKKMGVLLMAAVLIFTSMAFAGCTRNTSDDDLSQVPGVDDNLENDGFDDTDDPNRDDMNNRDDSLTDDLKDGADNLGDDIKDGAQDIMDDTKDALDGNDTAENRTN